EGLRPIIGCELDWKYNNGQSEILTKLIALSTKGYQNLMKISTAKMTGQDDFDSIRQFLQDIAVIVPFKDGVDKLDLGVDYYIGIYSDTPVQSFDHPVLPLHTVRYFQENQLESLQVLRAIKDNIPLNQVNEIEHQQVLLSAERLTMSFIDRYPQAISNLAQLVENVSYHLDKKVKLPRFN
ncbi:DNA polymerase III subunit alpha, partial [Enterococcus casseliflavus]